MFEVIKKKSVLDAFAFHFILDPAKSHLCSR